MLLEMERCRVDAIAQAGRDGSIREHMAQVGIAFCAEHFRAFHAQVIIGFLENIAGNNRFEEAGPAATGVKLGIGAKQVSATADALIGAAVLTVMITTAKGAFCTVLACHLVLFGAQLLPPFCVALV